MNDFEDLTTRVMALPAENRAELAELLVQSLEEQESHEVTSAWLAEIWRRDQEIRAGIAVLNQPTKCCGKRVNPSDAYHNLSHRTSTSVAPWVALRNGEVIV